MNIPLRAPTGVRQVRSFSAEIWAFLAGTLSEEQVEMSQRPTDGLVGSADKVLKRCVGNVRV